VDCLTTPTV